MTTDDTTRTWATHAAERAVDATPRPSLVPATVVDPLVNEGLLVVVVDGDTDETAVQNLIGRPVVPDDRVMVQFSPPSGAFAVAQIGDPQQLIARWDAGTVTACTTGSLVALPVGTVTDPSFPLFLVLASAVAPAVHGWWNITATVEWATSSAGDRFVDLWRTGGTDRVLGQQTRPAAATSSLLTVSGAMHFGSGDYVEVRARQSSGGDLDAQLLHLTMSRV